MTYFSKVIGFLSSRRSSENSVEKPKAEPEKPEVKTSESKPVPQESKEKKPGLEGLVMHKIMEDVFKNLGMKPTLVAVPVLMKKGDEYKNIYTIPETHEIYGNEKSARDAIKPDQTLYAVTVRRIE